jgi:hypothetical protein
MLQAQADELATTSTPAATSEHEATVINLADSVMGVNMSQSCVEGCVHLMVVFSEHGGRGEALIATMEELSWQSLNEARADIFEFGKA